MRNGNGMTPRYTIRIGFHSVPVKEADVHESEATRINPLDIYFTWDRSS